MLPADGILSFITEEKKKKSINVGELFSKNFGLNTENFYKFKRKSFCNFDNKKLMFLCSLEVIKSPFKFQPSVGRVSRSGGLFGIDKLCIRLCMEKDLNFLFSPSQKLSLM